MSNRTKKAKTDQLRAATGIKNGQHITKISAGSSRRNEASPSNAEAPQAATKDSHIKAELKKDGIELTPMVSDTGKAEIQPTSQADAKLNTPKKLTRAEKKALKAARRNEEERPIKTYFLLWRPFVALGRYLRDSWREIRQVRWPNRKATWKLTLAVLVYVAIFMAFLTLLDVFFTFIFDLLFK